MNFENRSILAEVKIESQVYVFWDTVYYACTSSCQIQAWSILKVWLAHQNLTRG